MESKSSKLRISRYTWLLVIAVVLVFATAGIAVLALKFLGSHIDAALNPARAASAQPMFDIATFKKLNLSQP